MGYERCELHGLMRCILCSPKSAPSAPTPVVVAPAVPAFNPEDSLDAPAPFSAAEVPVGPDRQAQEAIERQKEIQAARADNIAPEILELGDKLTERAIEHMRPLVKAYVEAKREENPVVYAAQEYAAAEKGVEEWNVEVDRLEEDFKAAKVRLLEATTDRDLKKQALQKLVAS